MDREFYAHSLEGRPPNEWQTLEEHLKNVANMARSFATDFGAGEWGYLAGLWHDIGKYSEKFQKKLDVREGCDAHIETKQGTVDHSTAGAQHAFRTLSDSGKILAYTIAGHHAGLMDGQSNRACLENRLKKIDIPDYSSCPEQILNTGKLSKLPFDLEVSSSKRAGFQISLFIRMIYSCLVDADFLDTEAFMDRERSSWRRGYPSLDVLRDKLDCALNQKVKTAPKTPINRHRAAILKDCLDAAELPQGLFSLTVPTGGGKTLSSLAFAIRHALKHNLKRIIYVIPYTSIIEQNAAVFREIMGNDAVLEHHSNFEPGNEDHRSRLASENWDAPIIVTTNVQFFESLFRCRASKCRKIHNMSASVVILDEAQMLPVPLLKPCIEVLRELAASYRTSVILCTATQPALSTSSEFEGGLDDVREIISDPGKLYTEFKRVQIEGLSSISDADLAERLLACRQVLCIVNTRKHARRIFERIRDRGEECYHLSALMCPEHRTNTLHRIRSVLLEGKTCRVVSTQLVEAGVDIDFPVVFRSLAGIDSIAQAAGRCNREGKLEEGGRVFVFSPEDAPEPGFLRQRTQTAEGIMRRHEDLLSQEATTEYFRTLYWIKGEKLDEYQVLDDLSEGAVNGNFPFKVVAKKFRLIKDGSESLIIPWNSDAEKIISGLRYSDSPGMFARQAQRFAVQVFPQVLSALECAGSLERLHDQYCVLINMDIYKDELGLCPEDPTFHEVESLIT